MEYRGYTARVEFDDQADLFHGEVMNVRDVITFQGRSVEELRREFKLSVDEYLAFCAERHEPPERPFSGRFLVRIDPALHREIADAAASAGVSINAWVASALERGVRTPVEESIRTAA